jgi:O-methyltransferase
VTNNTGSLGPRGLTRRLGKRSQAWLRTNRRMERALRRITRLDGDAAMYSHEVVIPLNSTYAPWHDDHEFRDAYNLIDGHTLVDQYKCHELWELLGQLEAVPGDILEVGVWRGGTGVLLALRASSFAEPPEVILADTFEGVVKASGSDPWYRGGEHADTSPTIVRGLAERAKVDVHLLVGIFPDATGASIDSRVFRLVHIDVDVYESAQAVLEWAWPRLSVGGVVIFDDYGSFECEGVATLGRELFAMSSPHVRLVHNLNGHLVLIKLTDGELGSLRSSISGDGAGSNDD